MRSWPVAWVGGAGSPWRAVSGAAASTYDECPSRHCWVADAVDGLGVKRPGLLVEWRRTGQAWEGRVVYAAQLRPGRWVMVEEWVRSGAAARRCDPADDGVGHRGP